MRLCNQLGLIQAIEELAQLWGYQVLLTSPAYSPIESLTTNETSTIVAPKTTNLKQKTVVGSTMDKTTWNIVSTEHVKHIFDCSLFSETTFVTQTQCAEKATVFFKTYRTTTNKTPLTHRLTNYTAPRKKRANLTPLIRASEDIFYETLNN